MADSKTRPLVHFTSESGWINDPLGLSYVDGQYHLFYQHIPGSTEWQPNCHWGHAVSTDLTTWTERSVALAPGEGDDGVWSGSIVHHPEHGPMLFYTSVAVPDFAIGSVKVAQPTDSTWDTWVKRDAQTTAPGELDLQAFRDPYVFRDGKQWRMLVGASLAGGTAAAASFSSHDCLEWSFDGMAAQRPRTAVNPVWTGSLWECPQVFTIDGQDIMVTSVWENDVLHYAAYAVGSYRDGTFEADSWHQLTYGDSYYAPSFFRDSSGEPCLIFWVRGPGGTDEGWAGALSVPHRLTLVDGRLNSAPHPEVLTAVSRRQSTGDDRVRTISWHPANGPLDVALENGGSLSLRRTEAGVAVRHGHIERTIPCSRVPGVVTLLVDRTVCEVFLGESVFAVG